MKLRMEQGNITIRLSPSEIGDLREKKTLKEELFISGTNRFSFTVNINDRSVSCRANFSRNSLIIEVPLEKAEKWMNSGQIGIKETIVTEASAPFVLVLEEDLRPRKYRK